MKPFHSFLAVLVAAIWGINFTILSIGLGSFPPLLLAALRFIFAALPVLFLPCPPLPWSRLIAIGATLFFGHYVFLFTGMKLGLPAGLASIMMQSQAFMTILIAAVFLREIPSRRQILGAGVAFLGLSVIASTIGGTDFTLVGFIFCLASALSWASGNVLLRGVGKVDMLALVSWLSLMQPIPLLALSLLIEGPATIGSALTSITWSGIGSVLYLSVFATTICFAIWSKLLARYPAANVVPYALLVPIFGTSSAALFLHERFNSLRLAGMCLVLLGLIFAVMPLDRFIRRLTAPR